ncbi:hypothetical protein [Tumebacillus flagellatus]|uniref:Uncharacterized protein n=1 Tax=Tumebacillus flagellatus TaxID=1157490 RepID=A0A074LRQ9_9BACL|nr:hypothetical protein [Tumebacillus flagellatus]KEO83804.1 hypothetical protein EL26_07755 [Tumebacillus flagellatus]
MSALWTIIVIIGFIVNVIRAIGKSKSNRQGGQRAGHPPSTGRQLPSRTSQIPQTPNPTPPPVATQTETSSSSETGPYQEQSAYEWIFGKQSPSSGGWSSGTNERADRSAGVRQDARSGTRTPDPEAHDDEDWIEPVQPSVHMDLEVLQESRRDVVHETVHESLHVRRSRLDEAPAPERAKHPLRMNRQSLLQAMLLKEALDPPRSLRPWKPGNRR